MFSRMIAAIMMVVRFKLTLFGTVAATIIVGFCATTVILTCGRTGVDSEVRIFYQYP